MGFWRFLGLVLLAVSVVTPGWAAEGKIHRLLIMDSQAREPYSTARQAMVNALADFGYREGRNLDITYHSIGNDRDKGREILGRELGKGYDVVFVNGTIMTLAAKDAAYGEDRHRFVYTCVTDPVGVGVIDGFDIAPKANFTGVSYPVPVKSRLKFIRQLMPDARTIGLIHADMPQSRSYRGWVEGLLENDPTFRDLKVVFRSVPLIKGEGGSERMAAEAERHVRELDAEVDVFLSPNDQMGVNKPFPAMVDRVASKPLVGVGLKEVTEGWGATMTIYPSQQSAGRQAARMIKDLLEGKAIADIKPEWPKENGFAFDLGKAKRFGIRIPVRMIEMAGQNIRR